MVKYLSSTYFVIGMDREDLEQELYLHILKHIHTYDPEKNDNIKYWLRIICKYQIVNLIKASKRKKRYTGQTDISLYAEVSDEFKLIDIIPAKSVTDTYVAVTDAPFRQQLQML